MGADAVSQALGYNHYVGAYFVAIAGEEEVRLVHPMEVPFLPSYHELKERVIL